MLCIKSSKRNLMRGVLLVLIGADLLVLMRVDLLDLIQEDPGHLTAALLVLGFRALVPKDLILVLEMLHSFIIGLADKIEVWRIVFVQICRNPLEILPKQELMVMMEEEVVQANQDLQHVVHIVAIRMVLMKLIDKVWTPSDLIDVGWRDGNLMFIRIVNLSILNSLRH
uniref:Uncharacterized protein n=1 Tax=Opuntia streptacantha TaxID=393608 RepID=A0A7C9D6T0_OPUST